MNDLYDACKCNNIALIEKILKKLSNKNFVNVGFQYALELKNIKLAKLFITKFNVDINFNYHFYLCTFASKGNLEAIKFLLQNNPSSNINKKSILKYCKNPKIHKYIEEEILSEKRKNEWKNDFT